MPQTDRDARRIVEAWHLNGLSPDGLRGITEAVAAAAGASTTRHPSAKAGSLRLARASASFMPLAGTAVKSRPLRGVVTRAGIARRRVCPGRARGAVVKRGASL